MKYIYIYVCMFVSFDFSERIEEYLIELTIDAKFNYASNLMKIVVCHANLAGHITICDLTG